MIKVSVVKLGGPIKAAPIEMWVTDEEVGLKVSLDDYLDGLVQQVGNPAAILTMAGLRQRLAEASDKVVRTMKQKTVELVSP